MDHSKYIPGDSFNRKQLLTSKMFIVFENIFFLNYLLLLSYLNEKINFQFHISIQNIIRSFDVGVIIQIQMCC